jgi:hypothetical protein
MRTWVSAMRAVSAMTWMSQARAMDALHFGIVGQVDEHVFHLAVRGLAEGIELFGPVQLQHGNAVGAFFDLERGVLRVVHGGSP